MKNRLINSRRFDQLHVAAQYFKDQHYFVRKSSETLRKVEMEIVRHQTRGRNATYTVKRIILPLT